MLKSALLTLFFLVSGSGAEEWISKDMLCGFTVPDAWKEEASEEKNVEVQFHSADNTKAINVSMLPIPKNFHLTRKQIETGVAKQGGTVLTFEDKGDKGVPTITYTWDLPGTGQFLVIMKYNETKAYKWQGFTGGKIAEAADVMAAGKTFHLGK